MAIIKATLFPIGGEEAAGESDSNNAVVLLARIKARLFPIGGEEATGESDSTVEEGNLERVSNFEQKKGFLF